MKLTSLGSSLTLLTLGVAAACAAPVVDDSARNGTGGAAMGSGGDSLQGTGGTTLGTGGTTLGTGGTTLGTGGTTLGTGGTTLGTGGATVGSGGAMPGAGGTAAGTGGAETAGGVECMGSDFTPAAGFIDTGDFCGYAFTYAFDAGGTISPKEFDEQPTTLCATGSVPVCDAEAGDYPGVAIGVNLAQDNLGEEDVFEITGSGITVKYDPGGAVNMQANILTSAGEYCAPLSGSGTDTLDWSDFKIECYNASPGDSLAMGDKAEQLHIQVQCQTAEVTPLADFCLTGLALN